MAKKIKPPRLTREQLERKLLETQAQLAHVYHFASLDLQKASTSQLMGSGVILQLSFLGGKEVFAPVCIKDGLSPETVEAIRADLKRSFNLTTSLAP